MYHGTQFPSTMQGNYFFADYARRWIKRLTFDANGNVSGVFNFEPISGNPKSAGDIVYLTEGPDGALYYVDLGYSTSRDVRRQQAPPDPLPPVQPGAGRARVGQPDLGSAAARSDLLQRGLERPRGPADHLLLGLRRRHLLDCQQSRPYTDAGQYLVRLTVSDGVNSSISTPLSISVGNVPTARIDSPAAGPPSAPAT